METVKKINLLDATNNEVYHDKFGWVNGRLSVTVKGKISRNGHISEGQWEQHQLCVKNAQGNYKILSDMQLTNKQLRNFDFGEVFYKSDYCGSYYKIEEPIALLSWHNKEITPNTQIEVYEGVKRDVELKDWQIKEGLLVQYTREISSIKKGTFLVTKLFEQPNRENNLCVIEKLIKYETTEAEPITIKCNQKVLYSVPYETYEEAPDETSIFKQPLNEDLLAPFIEKTANESKDANLYWLPIEDASAYTVSLYKRRNAEQQKYKIYLLERFEVDRNQHWITLHNLIGNGYIVLLEAESREGSVIARTRGINVDTKNLEWF